MVFLGGGFTTFSTFSKESLALAEAGRWCAFAAYAFGSIAIGIAAAYDENGKADACTLAFYTPTSHKPPTLLSAGSYSKRRDGMQSQMTISFLGLWENCTAPTLKGAISTPFCRWPSNPSG